LWAVEDVTVSAAIVYLLVRIIAGALAGNAAGVWIKDCSLGKAGNTTLGVIGGVGGGLIVPDAVAGEGVKLDLVIAQLAAGGIGGAMFTYVLGLMKNAMRNE
jgi:hypothetical protein